MVGCLHMQRVVPKVGWEGGRFLSSVSRPLRASCSCLGLVLVVATATNAPYDDESRPSCLHLDVVVGGDDVNSSKPIAAYSGSTAANCSVTSWKGITLRLVHHYLTQHEEARRASLLDSYKPPCDTTAGYHIRLAIHPDRVAVTCSAAHDRRLR
jgi:hypothetical protein